MCLWRKEETQFDIWRNNETSFETDSLIVTDKDFPIGQKIYRDFKSIKFVRDIEINIGKNL